MKEQLSLFKEGPGPSETNRIRIDWYSPIYNMHMYWTKQKPEVVARYIQKYCPVDGTVMDAFCGSGMTGVAAMLTGRKAILSDLSPLCAFLASNFTSRCDDAELKSAFSKIVDDIEQKFDWMLKTDCHSCGNESASLGAVILADNFACPECGHEQNLCEGGAHLKLKKGQTLDIIKCGSCGHKYDKVMKYFVNSEAVSVEIDCDSCGKHGKANSRNVSKADKKLFKKIDEFKLRTFVPRDVRFPEGINTKRVQLRGITHAYELFSKMNLILLSTYWSEVEKLEDAGKVKKAVADKLKFIATSAMFHASLMRRWLPYRTGVPLKGTLFVPSITEDVPLLGVLRHQAKRVFKGQQAINASAKSKVEVKVASALKLDGVEDNSIDYLFYDPPFGGHINYSELNIVWEAWLGKVTNSKDEVIVNRVQGKDMDDYANMLRLAIEEGTRKLKVGGHFTIVFAHSDLKIWRTLQESTHGLPLAITGTPEVLDSSNKTFIQLFSERAQQSMITFTFKKTKGTSVKRPLKANFQELAEKIARDSIDRAGSGASRDRIYDHVIEKLFGVARFETFDLDTWLDRHCVKTGNKWFARKSLAPKRTGS